ncbi:Na-translocating system protein MpsC family protein [Bacillus sp. 31A1R]|uniref:Na-translocating system protein MpsC family protein n=1 Tax=Robertmurraya mangrovi TaxID=3098077 RepID=A0ABU5J2U5_9BACI|nr:Na-translocating system protein MpsC family protein [Bacillus sp. 31A1R]MDZ5473681.1 Na-translocating system protein MpsC family protein [Bacillus sp. 31A1R]
MLEQEKLNTISSFTSKILRKNFGKGPQSCQSALCNKHLVIYIKGFISPMEDVLMQQGQNTQVEKARSTIINIILEELKGVIEVTLDCDIEEQYHDWNFPNNSGVIMFVLNHEDQRNGGQPLINMTMLENEVARISVLVQKLPDEIKIHPISATIYLVERKGILVPIEKALISKGFEEELRITKDELEKEHFHRNGRFNDIFQKNVSDIFIDWNMREDKALMAFVLST